MRLYVTLSSLSRTSENSRSNLNSKFAFSTDPVHWAVTFSKDQTFINVFFQNPRNIWSNSFQGYLCGAIKESLLFFLCRLSKSYFVKLTCHSRIWCFKITPTNTQSSLPLSICTLTWKFLFYVVFDRSIDWSHPSLKRSER